MKIQEAFSKVWQRFVVEKDKPPTDRTGRTGCTYEYDGYCCAIGGLLPLDLRQSVIEQERNGDPIERLLICMPPVAAFFEITGPVGAEGMHPWSVLQGCHDNNVLMPDFNEQMEEALREFAQRFNLEIPA